MDSTEQKEAAYLYFTLYNLIQTKCHSVADACVFMQTKLPLGKIRTGIVLHYLRFSI